MSQINLNTKDDFQVVLLLSCFVGHPVCTLGCQYIESSAGQRYSRIYVMCTVYGE